MCRGRSIFRAALLAAVLLTFLLPVTAWAEEGPQFQFVLSVDGETEEQVQSGDTVTAALHLERTNLYIASASLAIAGVRTGTYYLWGTEVVNGRVRITNSTSNVGKYGKVTGWISVDDAKAGAGLRDQTADSRGLTKIVIDYASNVQAMAVYNLAQQLDLVAPGYYRSRYIDAAKTAQYIEIGQISAGDAEHVTTLCKKAAIEYKTAA